MGLFSRSKESPVLQKGYDEAYNHSLQSILKEGNHQYDDALTSWRYTLDGINTCLRNIDPMNLKSSTDKSLLTNLRDIERQCSDRIRYLEVKTGGAPANPYGTGMATGSSASILKKSTGSVNRVAVGSKSPVPPAKPSSSGNGPVAAATSSPKSRATKSQPALPKGYVYSNSRQQQPSSSAAHLAWGQKRGKGSPKVDEGLFTGFDGIQRTDSTGSTHRHTSSVPNNKLEPSPLLESAMAKVGQNRAQGIPQPQRQQRQGARFIITRSSPSLAPRNESPRQPHPTAALAAKRQAAAASGHAPQQQRSNNNNSARQREPVTVTTEPERSPSPEIDDWDKAALEKLKGLRGVDENAAKQILAEVVLKGDPVHWDDIAGLERAKSSLKETVVYPFLRPDLFSGLREPALGMLLFGPPGTGKTMLARAVATESHSTFFSISASSLTSKFMGESEKLVRALFQMAKALAPSIIFVDEIDSILTARSDSGEHEASRRIKTEFLVQWSDLQAAASGKAESESRRVLVLGATNLPWAIDEAARRRFVRRQYIPLPEEETRRAHLLKLLNHQKHALVPADVETLVTKTDGYSGSDLTALAKDAAMGPLRSLGEALLTTDPDQIRPMDLGDFIESMKTIRASVSPSGLREFEQWADNFGSSGA